MKVFYISDQSSEQFAPAHERIFDTICQHGIDVVSDEAELAVVDGVIADLSSQPPDILELTRRALRLGKPALVLAAKSTGASIPEDIAQQSTINQKGIRYSNRNIAASAIKVYLRVYLQTPATGNDRLSLPIEQDPDARGLTAEQLTVDEG